MEPEVSGQPSAASTQSLELNCLVCGQQSQHMTVNIFKLPELHARINRYLNKQLDYNSGQPCKLCANCLVQLQVCDQFAERSASTSTSSSSSSSSSSAISAHSTSASCSTVNGQPDANMVTTPNNVERLPPLWVHRTALPPGYRRQSETREVRRLVDGLPNGHRRMSDGVTLIKVDDDKKEPKILKLDDSAEQQMVKTAANGVDEKKDNKPDDNAGDSKKEEEKPAPVILEDAPIDSAEQSRVETTETGKELEEPVLHIRDNEAVILNADQPRVENAENGRELEDAEPDSQEDERIILESVDHAELPIADDGEEMEESTPHMRDDERMPLESVNNPEQQRVEEAEDTTVEESVNNQLDDAVAQQEPIADAEHLEEPAEQPEEVPEAQAEAEHGAWSDNSGADHNLLRPMYHRSERAVDSESGGNIHQQNRRRAARAASAAANRMPLKCPSCNRYYKWPHALQRHCLAKHRDISSAQSEPLLNGRRNSADRIKPTFVCKVCGGKSKVFDTVQQLSDHIADIHFCRFCLYVGAKTSVDVENHFWACVERQRKILRNEEEAAIANSSQPMAVQCNSRRRTWMDPDDTKSRPPSAAKRQRPASVTERRTLSVATRTAASVAERRPPSPTGSDQRGASVTERRSSFDRVHSSCSLSSLSDEESDDSDSGTEGRRTPSVDRLSAYSYNSFVGDLSVASVEESDESDMESDGRRTPSVAGRTTPPLTGRLSAYSVSDESDMESDGRSTPSAAGRLSAYSVCVESDMESVGRRSPSVDRLSAYSSNMSASNVSVMNSAAISPCEYCSYSGATTKRQQDLHWSVCQTRHRHTEAAQTLCELSEAAVGIRPSRGRVRRRSERLSTMETQSAQRRATSVGQSGAVAAVVPVRRAASVAERRAASVTAVPHNRARDFRAGTHQPRELCFSEKCCLFLVNRGRSEIKTERKNKRRTAKGICSEAYQCQMTDECSFISDSMAKVMHHEQKHHRALLLYNCEMCKGWFTSSAFLYKHQTLAHPAAYPCHSCGDYFGDKYGLQTHLRLHHDCPERFDCPYCSLTFIRRQTLAVHLANMHDPSVRINRPYIRTANMATQIQHRITSVTADQLYPVPPNEAHSAQFVELLQPAVDRFDYGLEVYPRMKIAEYRDKDHGCWKRFLRRCGDYHFFRRQFRPLGWLSWRTYERRGRTIATPRRMAADANDNCRSYECGAAVAADDACVGESSEPASNHTLPAAGDNPSKLYSYERLEAQRQMQWNDLNGVITVRPAPHQHHLLTISACDRAAPVPAVAGCNFDLLQPAETSVALDRELRTAEQSKLLRTYGRQRRIVRPPVNIRYSPYCAVDYGRDTNVIDASAMEDCRQTIPCPLAQLDSTDWPLIPIPWVNLMIAKGRNCSLGDLLQEIREARKDYTTPFR